MAGMQAGGLESARRWMSLSLSFVVCLEGRQQSLSTYRNVLTTINLIVRPIKRSRIYSATLMDFSVSFLAFQYPSTSISSIARLRLDWVRRRHICRTIIPSWSVLTGPFKPLSGWLDGWKARSHPIPSFYILQCTTQARREAIVPPNKNVRLVGGGQWSSSRASHVLCIGSIDWRTSWSPTTQNNDPKQGSRIVVSPAGMDS